MLVDGNPLENLKVLYPGGADTFEGGKSVHKAGIRWTLKEGRCYSAPKLLDEVKALVRKAREAKAAR